MYLLPLKDVLFQALPNSERAEIRNVDELRRIFTHKLPSDKIADNLAQFFRQQSSIILNEIQGSEGRDDNGVLGKNHMDSVRERTFRAMRNLEEVGLGGYTARRILAEVMRDALASHVRTTFSGKWESPSSNQKNLQTWVEDVFARFVVELLASMKDKTMPSESANDTVMHLDVERWQVMAINMLGALRTDELFNVIVEWENGSKGAIDDLRLFIKDPRSRTYLNSTFSRVISHRLLQPGASTFEILQVYISLIRTFTALDPKGVLLDRVARPIRRYLRDRDDTVTLVIGGLLADSVEEAGSEYALAELAAEMNQNKSLKADDEGGTGELDFDDMDWMPDPVDAGPDYKKSKNLDVIGSLISLFESKDVFVKEFQKILGERLLKQAYEFDREIRVLELLKLRFGETTLQACEVMLRDILDSRRVDASIQKEQLLHLDSKYRVEKTPQLHSRILSHLFWPSLHTESFFIPPEIIALQARYAKGFENLKQSRKLTWLHALGQVTVSLDLEDRTIVEEVQTWQASVIYSFQPTPEEEDMPNVNRTVGELVDMLSMTESLVLNALTFWVGKVVIKETSPRTYTVLETLTYEDAAHPGTTSAAIAAAAETATSVAAPAMLSEHEVVTERMDIFSQYIVGMLTNGGAMGLQQIVMMLKLTVPGGFPFGNEELKDFLEEEVKGGRLDFANGSYRIKH